MISKQITTDDYFLDMSLGARALYFFFMVNADDDGFIGSPSRLRKLCGATQKNFDELVDKSFLILFEKGVVVIRHWRSQNALRADRYKSTVYQEELSLLTVDKAGNYILKSEAKTETDGCQNGIPMVAKMETDGCQNGNQMEPQYSIDKNRIDKGSIDQCSVLFNSFNNTDKRIKETRMDGCIVEDSFEPKFNCSKAIPVRKQGYS